MGAINNIQKSFDYPKRGNQKPYVEEHTIRYMVKIKTGNRTNNGCQNHTENYTLKKKEETKTKQEGLRNSKGISVWYL